MYYVTTERVDSKQYIYTLYLSNSTPRRWLKSSMNADFKDRQKAFELYNNLPCKNRYVYLEESYFDADHQRIIRTVLNRK